MKPIGEKPGVAEYFSTNDSDNTDTERSPVARAEAISTKSARVEDIFASLPGKPIREESSQSARTATNTAATADARVRSDFNIHLASAVQDCGNVEDVQSAVAAVLQALASIEFVGWYTAVGERIGQGDRLEGLTATFSELPAEQQQTLKSCLLYTSPSPRD